MKISEIAFTCYPVTDVQRAKAFYEGVLGLTCTMDHEMGSNHWVEYDIGHGTLSIGKSEGWNPSSEGCSVGLEVDDFDSAIAELKAADIPFQMDAFETPVCHMAMVQDPDGNVVIIHQRKPSEEQDAA
ncbi:MAG: VOC family protein [Chthoniobacterales bacterium]